MTQVGTERGDDLTPEQQHRVQRAWRRRVWLVVGMIPLYVVAGLVGAWVARRDHPSGTGRSVPWWVPALVLVVGLVLVGTTLLLARRQYTRSGRVRSLLAAGEQNDLRRVSRLLRRGRPVPDEDRPVAQAYVDLLPRQVLVGAGLVALMVVDLLLTLRSTSGTATLTRAILVVGGAGGLLVLVQSLVTRRRAAAQGLVPAPRRRRRS